ncbi:conserved Plasmodium protein, unknown function [Plasmodium ovale]|uniref:Uncharacterized protein n=2 Tax=Plasmodium ovale TaxID=36330 RepID=A0A1A8VTM0_PLAOA|nr:conserved Plasmodium protein, unknown function [Plasmodium ovale curtisi]SBS82164.1 conserved Plasmodium protein, unknown function [Plasmodium ovale curtisi]SCN43183.1 conserved Plasmodium protein, unknown function [Plasmodium ovale]
MNFYLNVLEEIEYILEKCNSDTYAKISRVIEYIARNYKGADDEPVAHKGSTSKRKKSSSSASNSGSLSGGRRSIQRVTSGKREKGGEKELEGTNSIRNYFKVIKREPDNMDHGDVTAGVNAGSNADANVNSNEVRIYPCVVRKKDFPLINIFFLYGNFNVVIIIYYIIHKVNLFNTSLFTNESGANVANSANGNKYSGGGGKNTGGGCIPCGVGVGNRDFLLYHNKYVTHVLCSQLRSKNLSDINEVLKEILSCKINSFKIFILESFDFLPEQFRKIFMNKIIKNKNLLFIHSSVYLNDIFLSNCLYIRIPRPDKILFTEHILSIAEKKYCIDLFSNNCSKRNYLINVVNNCYYDITLILTMLYIVQRNKFPDIKKMNRLVINTNIKKLINTIHKCTISSYSFFFVRNIFNSILYTYNFDMDTFLTIFCKQLTAHHKDDDNYKKEIYSLFSQYSYYCSLHTNHLCSLENLTSKVILIEKKYLSTLNPYAPADDENSEPTICANVAPTS